jgi:predicted phage tail protein
VRLHGWLGERFGREWRLDVATPREAVRAIACQVRGF